MHWSAQYLGKKWKSGGRGPDTFDCWGLIWWIYRKHLGIELPSYPGVDALNVGEVQKLIHAGTMVGPFCQEWHRLTKPADMCGVAMGKETGLTHVGLFVAVDGGLILHCSEHASVIAQKVRAVERSGMPRIEFYQHGAYYRNLQSV